MQKGITFYAKHAEAGTAGYKDEVVLIGNDALIRMNPTFAGCPIYIEHILDDVEDVRDGSVGIVEESFFNLPDGAHWCKILITSEDALNVIKQGYQVSSSYYKTEYDPTGGTKNNVPYNSEVINGDYDHLALVKTPRYESSVILTPEAFKAYNAEQLAAVEKVRNSKEEPILQTGKTMENELIDIDGDKLSLDDLIGRYRELKSKIEEHKVFEAEEDKNRAEYEQIEQKEEAVMDSNNGEQTIANVSEVAAPSEMDDLDKRIAAAVAKHWEMCSKGAVISEQKDAPYKDERVDNAMSVEEQDESYAESVINARLKAMNSMDFSDYETRYDRLERGNKY